MLAGGGHGVGCGPIGSSRFECAMIYHILVDAVSAPRQHKLLLRFLCELRCGLGNSRTRRKSIFYTAHASLYKLMNCLRDTGATR